MKAAHIKPKRKTQERKHLLLLPGPESCPPEVKEQLAALPIHPSIMAAQTYELMKRATR